MLRQLGELVHDLWRTNFLGVEGRVDDTRHGQAELGHPFQLVPEV